MYSMFRDAFSFNQDLFFDTSNVIDMSNMFYGASAMKGDLSSFDTSNVFSMESMFRNTAWNGDISMWDVRSVVVATQM
jgi:surface protein